MKNLSVIAPAVTILYETAADCLATKLKALAPMDGDGDYILYAKADVLFFDDGLLCRLFERERTVLGSLASPMAVLCPVADGDATLESCVCEEEFNQGLSRLAERMLALGGRQMEAPAPYAPKEWRRRLEAYRVSVLEEHLDRGVSIPCFDGVMVSPLAVIGAGTEIQPGTQLRHGVTVGRHCNLGPNTVLEEASVGDGCTVNSTQIYRSTLDESVKIGPFCHVRPGSHLCRGVKVGDFVEIKNSTVGADTHASHLNYICDSDVG